MSSDRFIKSLVSAVFSSGVLFATITSAEPDKSVEAFNQVRQTDPTQATISPSSADTIIIENNFRKRAQETSKPLTLTLPSTGQQPEVFFNDLHPPKASPSPVPKKSTLKSAPEAATAAVPSTTLTLQINADGSETLRNEAGIIMAIIPPGPETRKKIQRMDIQMRWKFPVSRFKGEYRESGDIVSTTAFIEFSSATNNSQMALTGSPDNVVETAQRILAAMNPIMELDGIEGWVLREVNHEFTDHTIVYINNTMWGDIVQGSGYKFTFDQNGTLKFVELDILKAVVSDPASKQLTTVAKATNAQSGSRANTINSMIEQRIYQLLSQNNVTLAEPLFIRSELHLALSKPFKRYIGHAGFQLDTGDICTFDTEYDAATLSLIQITDSSPGQPCRQLIKKYDNVLEN